MRWQFKPHQKEIKLVPGETALAFYTARNPSDEPVTGIATYNVIPFEAGLYFNKIQCFCFEEQRLNPREQVGSSSLIPRPYHELRLDIIWFGNGRYITWAGKCALAGFSILAGKFVIVTSQKFTMSSCFLFVCLFSHVLEK